MKLIDLVPSCFGLFAREIAPSKYAIHAAEGEGFGGGEPWIHLGDDVEDADFSATLAALQQHDAAAEIVPPPNDGMVVIIRVGYDAEPELVHLDALPEDMSSGFVCAENGDCVANAVQFEEFES